VQGVFLEELAFQQLLNETMSMHFQARIAHNMAGIAAGQLDVSCAVATVAT